MGDNTENQRSEGGSGQGIESGNMKILMKSMEDMREHQRLLGERLGILPPRHNPVDAGQTLTQGDMIMSVRNWNQPGELLQQYLKLAPDEFSGSPPDPEKVEEWLQNTEHVLEHVSNDKTTWVKFATYRFRGPSRDWWNTRFKVLFIDKYVPDSARDRKFSEFMSLTKGDMSVSAYNDKYSRFSRYGIELIAIEETNSKKFIRGLDPEIRKQLSCLRIKTYLDALSQSLDYEKEMEDQSATRVRERPQQFSARQDLAKRPMTSNSSMNYLRPPIRSGRMG
ncbi:hypothetical protein MKW98_025061 [Papaver atlanticum]|uniref:Ty3 transposon capsid-like protein domain-containing protein n=1 Tax=Papaver atlanticum TaxID=357466 RepID=A0AAD4XIH5_9MAGN|nr:hypothetical protein MKW98_025061 [Papaver atlanticum]